MKLRFLGTFGGQTKETCLTSFLINDHLALDAGSLARALSLEEQALITDILISHAHMDHILSLPFLADNLFGEIDHPLRILASVEVIEALRAHVFNDVIWPDFTALPSAEEPILILEPFEPEVPFRIGRTLVTAIPVNHVVPCHGFLLQDERSALIYSADTCTTDRIWEIANGVDNLDAVIVDCSFPNEMEELAIISGHMTPHLLARDLEKLEADCEVLVYHLKPNFQKTLLRQLSELKDPRLVVSERPYRHFGLEVRRAAV